MCKVRRLICGDALKCVLTNCAKTKGETLMHMRCVKLGNTHTHKLLCFPVALYVGRHMDLMIIASLIVVVSICVRAYISVAELESIAELVVRVVGVCAFPPLSHNSVQRICVLHRV